MTRMQLGHLVLAASKCLIQLGLLLLFLYYFGIPSVQRYLNEQVLTVSTVQYPGEIQPPTVTVVAFSGEDGGWNEAVTSVGWEALNKVCGKAVDIAGCVETNTRSLAETVHAELGYNLRKPLTAPSLWREDFTEAWYGRSFTLIYPHATGTSWRTDTINLHVNTSDGLTRRIFIHDPDYFLLSVNPLALPINLESLLPRAGRVYYSIALTEHRDLNTRLCP